MYTKELHREHYRTELKCNDVATIAIRNILFTEARDIESMSQRFKKM